jgi:hypothetical protein
VRKKSYPIDVPQMCYSLRVAKLTVYIPDDLLDRARSQGGQENTSQLVQRGLQALVGGASTGYARRPADAEQLIADARARLAPAAEEEFQRGYRAALTTMNETFWPLLDQLAQMDFDLQRWARGWVDGMGAVAVGLAPGREARFSPPRWWPALAGDLGTMVDPIGFDKYSFTPTTPFKRGYEAALRDAWSAVERPTTPGADDSAAGTDEATQ